MNIRKGFDVESLKALSMSREGREILLVLTLDKDAAVEMLKDEKLLSVVIKTDAFITSSMTLAHCLVLGGDAEVKVALSKMPARVLELRTDGNDKVVDFLIAEQSANVNEALAGNIDALSIICGDSISDSGHINVYGRQVKVMSAEMAQKLRNNSVAHLLLHNNPSRETVEKISGAPKRVLEHRNGEGVSVQEMLEGARAMLSGIQRQKSRLN